jgi:N-acetylmuramoyl-L-alanine amidase
MTALARLAAALAVPVALLLAGCTSAAPSTAAPLRAAIASPTGPAGSTTARGSASPSPSYPLAGKIVALDPGHDGGNETHLDQIAALVPQGFGQYKACDTTGTNADDGYTEHQFNFQIAQLVKTLLQQRGITVVLTRTTDTGVGPCVDQRAAIGNQAHANAAVSIHADGNQGGHGYQILEAAKSVGGAANDAASHRLAVAMHTAFDRESGLVPSTYAGIDGYEPRPDIAGLNLSTVPKVLVECGNMKDPGDLALEESPAGRARIAQAIADSIISYLTGA